MEKLKYPKVSIVIPTLNAERVLQTCFDAINMQDYPKDKIELVIADGGSTDITLKLAKKYNAKVVSNPLKTAEAGKAVGVRHAIGDFIALIDSDNFLPSPNWLKQMVIPLMEGNNKDVLGSEPWEYTWREEDGFIDRYCALIGMNDPFVNFIGNYDRFNLLTNKWTEVPHEEEDKGNYLLVTLDKRGLPTLGANGTIFRAEYLKKELGKDKYLFDIDILARTLKKNGHVKFIKVKTGIIHAYCASDIKKFIKKQRRRVKDFFYHKFVAKDRDFDWESNNSGKASSTNVVSLFFNAIKSNKGMFRFILSCLLIVPLFIQALVGYSRKKDVAWLFHPLACEITLWEYGWGTLFGLFKKEEISRVGWKQ
jgi:glycosyltransferase involved in cell wall biosynthesis